MSLKRAHQKTGTLNPKIHKPGKQNGSCRSDLTMNFFLRCALSTLHLVQLITDLVQLLFCGRRTGLHLPEIKSPLLKLSATALARKLRKKEITSEELVQAFIKRVQEVNLVLNAVVEERFQEALQDARRIDTFLRKTVVIEDELERNQPLLGIPITIKESLAVKGLSYTGCSKTRAGVKADEDSEVVLLLKKAGAIPLLVSNTPEYCTSVETANKIIGITCNPYNSLYSSGGSSGGEGALIGSAASVIGIGSDIAGSIRIPAAFNGVFGHKPTSGLVSLKGHFPYRPDRSFTEYLVVGPMTRYAEDLKLVLKIIAGKNVGKLKLETEVDLSGLTVYYMEECGGNFGIQKVDESIKTAIRESVRYLNENCGCKISDFKFEGLKRSLEMFCGLVFKCEKPLNVLTDSEVKYNFFAQSFKAFFGKSIFPAQTLLFLALLKTNFLLSSKSRKYYQEEATKLKELFDHVLADNGVFLYPSFPTAAFRCNSFLIGSASSCYPAVFNVLGLPATCVPTGFNQKGLPVGIQVVAGPNQDRLTLRVAQQLEQVFGGWREIN